MELGLRPKMIFLIIVIGVSGIQVLHCKLQRLYLMTPQQSYIGPMEARLLLKAIDEDFDREKGLSMAITKKVYGNTGNYYNIIKKWCNGSGDDNGQK